MSSNPWFKFFPSDWIGGTVNLTPSDTDIAAWIKGKGATMPTPIYSIPIFEYVDNRSLAWHAAIKEATGAIDEVYAVIDGREVRVAIASNGGGVEMVGGPRHIAKDIADLLIKADEQGYWERPHEVIHVLEERAISRRTVNLACGVMPDKVGA